MMIIIIVIILKHLKTFQYLQNARYHNSVKQTYTSRSFISRLVAVVRRKPFRDLHIILI